MLFENRARRLCSRVPRPKGSRVPYSHVHGMHVVALVIMQCNPSSLRAHFGPCNLIHSCMLPFWVMEGVGGKQKILRDLLVCVGRCFGGSKETDKERSSLSQERPELLARTYLFPLLLDHFGKPLGKPHRSRLGFMVPSRKTPHLSLLYDGLLVDGHRVSVSPCLMTSGRL